MPKGEFYTDTQTDRYEDKTILIEKVAHFLYQLQCDLSKVFDGIKSQIPIINCQKVCGLY